MDKKKIAISPFGLKDTEHRLLKTICAVSDNRDQPYTFIWSPEPSVLPTIWIVDAEVQESFSAKHQNDGALAVIISNGEAPAGQRWARRPITASRMLAELDAVAAARIGDLSGLVIGETSGSHGGAAAFSALTATKGYSAHVALVVDDSQTIQKQIELGLRLHNVAAVCVDSGEAAMAALEKRDFDLIFLDVVLPGGTDGYQICKAIKKNKANKDIPVVMLTSKSSAFDRVRGSMVGCDTYLTKPVDNETFSSVVAKYLPKAQENAHQLSGGQVPA
jgi:twitching motility two-component system response regulator PilG